MFLVLAINYIDLKIVVCWCPQVTYVIILNHDSLCRNVTVDPGIRIKLEITYQIELNVRKPLVVFILQISEELRVYNLVQNLKISNSSFKAVSSNASPGQMACFGGGMSMIGVF